MTVIGNVVPPTGDDETWRLSLGLAEPGTLAAERPNERNLAITDLSADALVLPFAQKAVLSRALIKGPDLDVAITGTADWSDGLRLKFNGEAGQGWLRSLLRLWPSQAASAVRGWMIGHTHGGVVRKATMSADYDQHALQMMRFGRPPPDASLAMDFTIANGSVDALAGLAPITNLDAVVHVTGRSMRMEATGGTLDVANGRRVTLLAGQLQMPNNDGSAAVPAHLSIRASAPVEAAAELLAKDSMRSYAQLPVDAATLHGRVEGTASVDFEVGEQARASAVTAEAALTATDFAIDKVIGKERLEGATVSLTADAAGVKANGTGRIFGAPVSFDLRKAATRPASVAATMTLDDAARARAGFALSGVTGPIGAHVNATIAGEATKAQVDLDLTRTAIENGIPGLVKPAGKPAKLAFTVEGSRHSDHARPAGLRKCGRERAGVGRTVGGRRLAECQAQPGSAVARR